MSHIPSKDVGLDSQPVELKPRFYGWSVVAVALLTLFGLSLNGLLLPVDQALIYIMGVVPVAAKLGCGPSLLYSLLSVTCFNFFFIPPIYSFNVYDRAYWLTFGVMLLTGFVIASQASRLRLQALLARKRERDTQTLYVLTRKLASMRSREDIVEAAAKHIEEMFAVKIDIWLPDQHGQLRHANDTKSQQQAAEQHGILQRCFENSHKGPTETMQSAQGFYLPLSAVAGSVGVMDIIKSNPERRMSSDEVTVLETCANLLASALERANIAEMAEQAKIDTEREKMRTMLLSSVSHDLRTPLASITGASSTIVTDIDRLPLETICELGRSINTEAERLSHIVTNLLEVTRLESGTVQLNKQPYFVEELIGAALERVNPILVRHRVLTQSTEGLSMVAADGILIEQVLINLLENAARYTPSGSIVTVSATRKASILLIKVADNGPGIPAGNEIKIFDKFYSLSQNNIPRGTGLGLAICASIIKAHNGEIWLEQNLQDGACFCFTLPVVDNEMGEIENVDND